VQQPIQIDDRLERLLNVRAQVEEMKREEPQRELSRAAIEALAEILRDRAKAL
jgi:hypothetical protein